MHKVHLKVFSRRDFLDEDNCVLTITSLERFFELFIKHILFKTNPLLIKQTRSKSIQETIDQINAGSITDSQPTIPFSEALIRFYDLIEYSKIEVSPNHGLIVQSFEGAFTSYHFLDSNEHRASLEYINWWRNRILHNGNTLPSLWLLDYSFTQLWIPMILEIIRVDEAKLGDSLFYLKTVTDFNILETLGSIKYRFDDWKSKGEQMFSLHLYIGHIKELGRANLNMNLFVRSNHAGYEYNYRDPKGRGKRFANAEKVHPHFKEVKLCPCCGEESLVLYRETIEDIIFNPGSMKNIDWVKCYTCDYHLRYNVGDMSFFNEKFQKIFN